MTRAEFGTDNCQLLFRECSDHIFEFGNHFQMLQQLYDEMGFRYPEECHTNYRDSWFHYRKLYTKKDEITISNEKYGLEEHLLRAEKDAQIDFLQRMGQLLEIWYHCDEILVYDSSKESEYLRMCKKLDMNWVQSLWRQSSEDEMLFSNACICYYQKNIFSKALEKDLQELIHGIKNLILDIRMNGVNIFRPQNHMQYLARSIGIYNKICLKLQDTGMLYLVPCTGVILKNCGKNESLLA